MQSNLVRFDWLTDSAPRQTKLSVGQFVFSEESGVEKNAVDSFGYKAINIKYEDMAC